MGTTPIWRIVSGGTASRMAWSALGTDASGCYRSSRRIDAHAAALRPSLDVPPGEVFAWAASAHKPSDARITVASTRSCSPQLDLPRSRSRRQSRSRATSRCRCGSSSRPASTPKKKWPVAYLVHGGPQGGVGGRLELSAGTRSCGPRRATSSPCRIRAAAPASARSTSTRSAATGAASATTTSWPGSTTSRSCRTSTRTAWPRPGHRSAAT